MEGEGGREGGEKECLNSIQEGILLVVIFLVG